MLDWIFEGAAQWVASIMTQLMDAVSGIFLEVLGTDMTVMEEYFPFAVSAYSIIQYTAWAILFLAVSWQLFRAFGGPITEAENPLYLLVRGGISALLIGYAKPIFLIFLDIARAPYTALMDVSMDPGAFTFAGIEQILSNGLLTIVSAASVVGLLLMIIMMVALAWNYFKLLLETVERYVLVGVLCYTSPLAYSMGASKATSRVLQSWCRMVGSQLLLLVLNVWFLRAFNSSVGQFLANGGALTNGQGGIFLWLFCALALLKIAQRCDSHLSALGLSVAQTGSSMGMEMLMAARVVTGFAKGGQGAASFGASGQKGTSPAGTTPPGGGPLSGFASRYKPNSFVRDAVVNGGARMGAGGGLGFVGRVFGGVAAKGGTELTAESVASVASRPGNVSGSIGGEIADRSLANFMPHLAGTAGNATAADAAQRHAAGTPAGPFVPGAGFPQDRTPIPGQMEGVTPASQRASEFVGQPGGEIPERPNPESVSGGAPVSGNPSGETFYSGVYTGDSDEDGSIREYGPGGHHFINAEFGGGEGGEPGPYAAEAPGTAAAGPTTALPQEDLSGYQFTNTQITGGHISTTAVAPDGREANVELFSTAQYECPDSPHTVVNAADGSQWYQVASGDAMGAFYPTPAFSGDASEAGQVAEAFPHIPEGTMLRQVEEGVLEASAPEGGGLWYSSAFYQEPDAPHETVQGSNGLSWYAMAPHAEAPQFEEGEAAASYNRSLFGQFMPSYDKAVTSFDSSRLSDGMLEVRHEDGSGARFYDRAMYQQPRGDYKLLEDSRGGQWYAISGTPSVERRPVYEAGKPVYEGEKLKTVSVETVRYPAAPTRFSAPKRRPNTERKVPKKKT